MSINKLPKGFSTIIIIIIAVLVLLGAGAFFMTRDSSTGDTTQSRSDSESMDIEESDALATETTSTFPEVIGRGQSLECDWRIPIEVEDNPFDTGKLYTNGSKGRTLMTGNISGAAFEGNAIYMDNEVYSWMSVGGNTFGFKFDEDTLESESDAMTPQEREQAENIRAEMIIDCQSWTPDESLFELPEGVEFR